MNFFAGFGLAIVLLAMTLFGRLLWRAHRSSKWPTTTGIVKQSGIQIEMPGDEENYFPKVQFEYKVAGKSYLGTRIRELNWMMASPERAWIVADRYPAGKAVIVRYHPEKPEMSVLEPGFKSWEIIVFFAFGAVAVLLALVMINKIEHQSW